MTDKKKEFLFLAALLALLILFFSKILFTGKIIRAPDITNEFYWTVTQFKELGFLDLFKVSMRAGWDWLSNGGTTEGGGTLSLQFLFYRNLIFWLFPAPANVAWFIVLHLFFGAAGTYLCCRAIGASRTAALLGGLIFALAPENASLINAGHAQKIATISFAPWGFYLLERGFQSRRVIWFLATGFVLAFQFFNMHWQIAYYTCLGIGVYGVARSVGMLQSDRLRGKQVARLLGLNLVTLFFFLSTVAISLIPLADWSKGTTRGVQSGANQGQGGLQVEEAMMWSLPPEELATFVVPGLFGFSRQEGGYDDPAHGTYYWGRMVFTQTTDYMGLLPWLLLPLPLVFRRDRYTWLALCAVVAGILFSMGKYTPFYWFLYEHFPGINHFRVPKMMMFMPVLGLGVLAARGMDLLLDEEVRGTRGFRRYLYGLLALPVTLLLVLGIEIAGQKQWISAFYQQLAQPTRFEQGVQLVGQRWNSIIVETGIAALVAAVYGAVVAAGSRRLLPIKLLPLVLCAIFLADVGRVNAKFMLLQDLPEKVKGKPTPSMEFLKGAGMQYRVLPMNNTDPMQYVSHGIPVMFTSNPVQVQRWQDFLDSFSFASAMPDLMNVKYLIYNVDQYEQEKAILGGKYVPVYRSPDGAELVLENRQVLPKAWLVPQAFLLTEPRQALGIMQAPDFSPVRTALVESPPPVPMATPLQPASASPGTVSITRYEANRISLSVHATQNSLLVLGEKYYRGWRGEIDGQPADIYPVDYILRGVYLTPGEHKVEFVFDPLPFKIGKYLTLTSFVIFIVMLGREVWRSRGVRSKE